jgi:hypothetical protein
MTVTSYAGDRLGGGREKTLRAYPPSSRLGVRSCTHSPCKWLCHADRESVGGDAGQRYSKRYSATLSPSFLDRETEATTRGHPFPPVVVTPMVNGGTVRSFWDSNLVNSRAPRAGNLAKFKVGVR